MIPLEFWSIENLRSGSITGFSGQTLQDKELMDVFVIALTV